MCVQCYECNFLSNVCHSLSVVETVRTDIDMSEDKAKGGHSKCYVTQRGCVSFPRQSHEYERILYKVVTVTSPRVGVKYPEKNVTYL